MYLYNLMVTTDCTCQPSTRIIYVARQHVNEGWNRGKLFQSLIEEGKKCITIQSYPSQWVTVYNLRNQTEYNNYSNPLTKLPLYRNSFFPFFDQTLEQFDTT
jgi:hypothetical protein